MFSLEHLHSAGTCLQIFRIVDNKGLVHTDSWTLPCCFQDRCLRLFSLDDTYAQRGAFITQEALEGGVNLITYVDCKTVRIFAYSSTREQPNKRSGMMLKTESETATLYRFLY